jgi:hypothetical protein
MVHLFGIEVWEDGPLEDEPPATFFVESPALFVKYALDYASVVGPHRLSTRFAHYSSVGEGSFSCSQ